MRSMLQLNEGWFFLKEHPENLRSVPIDAKSVCFPHTWTASMVRMEVPIISVEHAAMQKRFSDLNFLLGSDISWRSTERILPLMCI